MFNRIRAMYRIRKTYKLHPDWFRDPTRIMNALNTPNEVFYWAMTMLEISDPLEDDERTPQEVIETMKGTPYEIVETMAYVLHHKGWKTIVMRGALDIRDLDQHPDDYFIIYSYMGRFYRMDNDHYCVGKDFRNALRKNHNYMATDWTGDRHLFAIMPKNGVPLRIDEEFDPVRDMP